MLASRKLVYDYTLDNTSFFGEGLSWELSAWGLLELASEDFPIKYRVHRGVEFNRVLDVEKSRRVSMA